MVQSKSDRERQKLITDKCQALIEILLKEDNNKYCVDCDAKGPRWASWNLGIFLCIRCAGIHRNLGVHISRVKSVNLDAWTPEHVAYVQRMGNGRARAIYEANLPEDFRRPQTDTALESFIRAKYEHKKYIAHDYVDPGPPEPAFNAEEELKRMKEQKRSKLGGSNKTISVTLSDSFAPSLSTPKSTTAFTSSAVTSNTTTSQQHAPSIATQRPQLVSDMNSLPTTRADNSKDRSNKSALADLMDLDFSNCGGSGFTMSQPTVQAFTMPTMQNLTPNVPASSLTNIDSFLNDPIMASLQTNPISASISQPKQAALIQATQQQQQPPQSNNKLNLIDF